MAGPADGLEATIAERREARERERRRSRRRRILIWVARILALVVVFFVGFVIGQAVEDAPRPGGTQTRVQTLDPSTLPPVTRTVTVNPAEP
jgi:predicted nucleic acid-binding Zn ribbon protein